MDQDYYISLIHQDLQGALPEAGQQQLAEWRLTDPEHPVLEEQVRKAWELSGGYEPELEVDVPAAFNVLRTRVRAHEKENTTTVRSLNNKGLNRRSWLAIAATLLLLLSAGWFFWPALQEAGPMARLETAPGDQPLEVALSDGSKIWLRENSSLEYPETFSGNTRQVSLTGEAFFEVAKNPDAPFRIALPGSAEVEVLGTSFLVSAQEDTSVEVTVTSGKVALNVGNKVLLLRGGKAGTWNPATGGIAELNYLPNAAAWRNNTLVFDDQPLAAVVRDMEAYFNITITFANSQLPNCRFAGRFPDAKLEDILDAMQQALAVNWLQIDGEYQLRDGNCQ
jgi:ferric-dicitrate binding protein FerR (iron transport regulator)